EGANAFAHVVGVEEKEEVPPLVRKALHERRLVGRARSVLRHLHGERSIARNPLGKFDRRGEAVLARYNLGHQTCSAGIVALIGSPVSNRRIALDFPIACTRRWVPPAPGISPRVTSGTPNRADSPAMTISQASAISQPPPSASPRTAA